MEQWAKWQRPEGARVVDQQVEATEALDLLGQPSPVVGIGDVTGDGYHPLAGQLRQPVRGPTVGHHGPAAVGEGEGQGSA